MALGGKTVQYTLAVNMETGQLTAESKRVAAEINLIQKSANGADGSMLDFARSAKHLKGELSLLLLGSFGGYALAVGALGDALSFAAGKAKEFMFGVKFDPKVLSDLNEYVIGLRNAGKAQSELMALRIQSLQMDIKINEAQNKTAAAGGSLVNSIFGGGPGSDPLQIISDFRKYLNLREEENKLINEKNSNTKDQYALLKELQSLTLLQAEKEYNEELKKSIPINQEYNQLLFERRTLFADEKLSDAESILSDSNLQMASFNMQMHSDSLMNQKEILIDGLESLDAVYEDNSMRFFQSEVDAHKAWTGEMNSLWQGFFLGIADGFAAMGEAAVNGKNAMASFGAVFLKAIAQLAVQFGSFLVLYGTGMGFIPGGQSFSAGAIAAGIALTVFGGALGALAGKLGGQGSGARGGDREQRFRDSNFNTSGGNGGTTIINNINFANTIGLTRDSMKEVGEVISAELFKQGRLGRIETNGA